MRARAPGSVTTMFAPEAAGGGGVSFATEDGVVADVEPADETVVLLDGERTDFEPVELACETLGAAARVELTAEVPVGCGFGASGAATLSTVLAADAEWGLGRDREDLVDVAARAELAAGTGQSDVYVQEQGGLAWDVGDGRGRRDRTDAVAYATFGGVETDAVLADEQAMQQVGAAAERTFPRFDPDAQLADLLALSWEFARETGLATDQVRRTVEEVEAAGEAATMAMVGETVVAVGGDLPDADAIAAGETRITPDGARTLRG